MANNQIDIQETLDSLNITGVKVHEGRLKFRLIVDGNYNHPYVYSVSLVNDSERGLCLVEKLEKVTIPEGLFSQTVPVIDPKVFEIQGRMGFMQTLREKLT